MSADVASSNDSSPTPYALELPQILVREHHQKMHDLMLLLPSIVAHDHIQVVCRVSLTPKGLVSDSWVIGMYAMVCDSACH